jgi:hypothetical protein
MIIFNVYIIIGAILALLAVKYGDFSELKTLVGEKAIAIAAVIIALFWLPMILVGIVKITITKEEDDE